MKTVSAVLSASFAALLILIVPSVVAANGDEYFENNEIAGNPQLVYFGSVKDDKGNYLGGVRITASVADPDISYDVFTNDIGRYRSMDVGRTLLELGYEIDPTKVTLTAVKPGYVVVRRLNRGRTDQTLGAVEYEFVMAKDEKGAATKK